MGDWARGGRCGELSVVGLGGLLCEGFPLECRFGHWGGGQWSVRLSRSREGRFTARGLVLCRARRQQGTARIHASVVQLMESARRRIELFNGRGRLQAGALDEALQCARRVRLATKSTKRETYQVLVRRVHGDCSRVRCDAMLCSRNRITTGACYVAAKQHTRVVDVGEGVAGVHSGIVWANARTVNTPGPARIPAVGPTSAWPRPVSMRELMLATMPDVAHSTAESVLCDRCCLLRFADRDFGGYPAEGTLAFDNDNRRRDFELDYVHVDQLPELPRLKASSEAGCAFCGVLRDAALTLGLAEPGHITFKMRYLWRSNTPGQLQLGLCMLVADISARFGPLVGSDDDARDDAYTDALVFVVDSEHGERHTISSSSRHIDKSRELPRLATNHAASPERSIVRGEYRLDPTRIGFLLRRVRSASRTRFPSNPPS